MKYKPFRRRKATYQINYLLILPIFITLKKMFNIDRMTMITKVLLEKWFMHLTEVKLISDQQSIID